MNRIIKLGNCIKCGEPVYVENVEGSPENGNIIFQACIKGGDCEVDILKTPFAIRNNLTGTTI